MKKRRSILRRYIAAVCLLCLCVGIGCLVIRSAGTPLSFSMDVFSEDGVHGHLSGEIMVIDNGIFPVQYTGKLTWNGVPYVDIDTRYPTHKRNIGEWIRYCVSQIHARRQGSVSGTFLPANASGLDGILYLQSLFCDEDSMPYVCFFVDDAVYFGPSDNRETNGEIKELVHTESQN